MRSESHALLYDRESHDTGNHVTHRALQLQTSAVDQPLLVLLGSSSLQKALVSDQGIAQGLDGIEPRTIFNLTNAGAIFLDQFLISTMIPDEARGWAILEVQPGHFARTPEEFQDRIHHPRLGLRSELLDSILQTQGYGAPTRTGNYFIDNRLFFLPRAKRLFVNLIASDDYSYDVYETKDIEPLSSARNKERNEKRLKMLAGYEQFHEANSNFLGTMIEAIQSRTQLRVMLLEAPIIPGFRFERVSPRFWEEYRRKMRDFATAHDAIHVDLSVPAALKVPDFHDFNHIGTVDSRKRFTEALTDRINQENR